MPRNLILLFDGTWNDRKDRTNVLRMRQSIASSGEEDKEQPCRYLNGVGTSWHNWLTGGLFGRGLSESIQAGYAWLAARHQAGDRLFIFGFSRGAYSARSCVGLIRKCGLLRSPTPENVEKAYALYRDKDVSPDHADAVTFRSQHSNEIRVRFIGVWDTVGALGVPLRRIPFSSDYYRWHDTALSKIVDYAYHALATDERREEYSPALWTEVKPENIEVEQRWFIGAHSNVGGGYDDGPPDLPNITLRWMQEKAAAAGLGLKSRVPVGSRNHLAKINDSYGEMAYGLYKLFNNPQDRTYGTGVEESVDASVWARWREMKSYRPGALRSYPALPAIDEETDLSVAQPH